MDVFVGSIIVLMMCLLGFSVLIVGKPRKKMMVGRDFFGRKFYARRSNLPLILIKLIIVLIVLSQIIK